ncbi:MAG TPA: hypothetical protein VEF07_00605 [Candidatus Binataceae bacterium]|nr:hypothetical protein [Candidatus Binataceae bacterium]
MRVRTWVGTTLAAVALIAASACQDVQNAPVVQAMGDAVGSIPGFTRTPGLDVRSVRSIKAVVIHKIAVMPLIDQPDQIDQTLEAGASESVSAEVYARASMMGGWEVVPQDDVLSAMQQLPPTTQANMDQNAIELGRKVAADGVIYGALNRYRERVGYDYAAQTPAAVAFTLHFVDENSKQVVWTAKFAKEQQALTQNILDLPNFIQRGARWVRAHDIAAEGVQESLDNLQSKLTIQPVLQGQ